MNQRATDGEDLLLIDAYSLAANFFLFALILILTLINPSVAKLYFPVLIALGAISAVGFLVFTVLMFKLQGMRKFREWLGHPHKLGIMWYIFRALLWFSLPITFLAGVIDILDKIPQDWQSLIRWIRGIILIWLVFVPLGAVVKLRVGRKWGFKWSVPKLPPVKFYLWKACQKTAIAIRSEGPLQFLIIAIFVAVIQTSAFLVPVFQWLPDVNETASFLKVLWQAHASILGVTVVVVTIIITVIANEKDRTRTWKLYAEKTRFVPIIWFNLLAIISEGIASLQASHVVSPIFISDKAGNLILSEGFLLVSSIVMAAMLFTVTMSFLNDDYVEDLAERRIIRAMPDAVEADLKRHQEFISRL